MSKKKIFTLENVDYFLDRVFLEYEQPELFSVCNNVGYIFIAMLVDAVNEKWLMTPISAARLCKLEYGAIAIREVFVAPEIPQIQLIEYNGKVFTTSLLALEEIGEDFLPSEDARLNWDNIPMPQIQEELFETAQKRQRDILDIRVISEKTQDHTIGAKEFGSLLLAINDTVNNLAKVHYKKTGLKRGLTNGCALKYIGNYAGSFGIRLEAEECSDLIDETKLTPVLEELFELLQITDLEHISEMVKEKSFDYSKALRRLLKYSSDNNAAMDFSFITPMARYKGNATWAQDFSRRTLTYLDNLISDEVKDEIYIGDLISVTTKQNKFGFITDTQEEISGIIDPSLKETKFTVKSHAKIGVKKTIKITNANEIEEKYRLISYEKLDS